MLHNTASMKIISMKNIQVTGISSLNIFHWQKPQSSYISIDI